VPLADLERDDRKLGLDDRDFDQLVDEARRRISQYSPEWTDLNDSDPGMALVKLFAYMTDLLIYRINQVPDRTYVKLLGLLGLEQAAARPAVADVTFTPEPGGPILVPSGWRLEAESSDGGDPSTFETENDLAAAGLPLAQVLVGSAGAQPTLVTPLNVPGADPIPVLGLDPIVGNAFYLGFGPADATTPQPFGAELRLRFWLPEPDRERVVVPLRTAPAVPPAGLVWEFLPESGQPWQAVSLIRDETVGFTREGYVLLEPPPAIAASPLPGSPDSCMWLRCRMTSGAYPTGKPALIDFVRPNTVPAVSLTTVVREMLAPADGGDAVSTGEADQVFRLRERPVAPGSLELVVEVDGDPEGPKQWTRVDDLLATEPDAEVYELVPETGEVRFGDGRNGRIPPAGAQVVATRYRYGGGAGANVPAGAISGPAPPRVSEVRNERPAFGGANEQPIEELKRQAPRRLRHRERAVTQTDYAELACEVKGVAAATAIPFAHPQFPKLRVPGAITVVILPEGDLLPDGSPPRLVPGLIDAVGRYLEERRTVGTELWIAEPTYMELSIQTLVEADPSRSMDTVARDVEQALKKAFDPRQAAFGRDQPLTAVYPVILDVDGVRGVRTLVVTVDGTERDLTATIAVPPDGLIAGRDHRVRAVPGEDL
jgi:predicted phage baseplate assembly protein